MYGIDDNYNIVCVDWYNQSTQWWQVINYVQRRDKSLIFKLAIKKMCFVIFIN